MKPRPGGGKGPARGAFAATLRAGAGGRNVREASGEMGGTRGHELAALGLEGAPAAPQEVDPRIAAFERELVREREERRRRRRKRRRRKRTETRRRREGAKHSRHTKLLLVSHLGGRQARRRAEREEREDALREEEARAAEAARGKEVRGEEVRGEEVRGLREELARRREAEETLAAELETLRSQLAEETPPAADELYVAELEAQVKTLQFQVLSMGENYVLMKTALDAAQEKATELDDAEQRVSQLMEMCEQLSQERDGFEQQLGVAQAQAAALAARLGAEQASHQQQDQNSEELEALRAENAALKQAVLQRDGELARQASVLKELREGAEQRRGQTDVKAAKRASSRRSSVVPGGAGLNVLAEDDGFEVGPWEPGAVHDTFEKLARAHMEAGGERVALQDKKVFRDVQTTLLSNGGNVFILREKSSGSIVACCGVLPGVGTFDVKYLGFAPVEPAADGNDNDDGVADVKAVRLGQLVWHASKWAKERGADQLVAYFPGTRADAEGFWGPCGFKFVGVGPAPTFAVRLARDLRKD